MLSYKLSITHSEWWWMRYEIEIMNIVENAQVLSGIAAAGRDDIAV